MQRAKRTARAKRTTMSEALLSSLDEIWRGQPQLSKAADAVYATLRTAISTGILPSGEQLKEEALAERLGVSRTPIRESFQRLEAEQLVQRVPYRGVVVSGITSQQITEFYMLRIAVDGTAASLAARKRTPVDVARLRWINSRMKEAAQLGNLEKITQTNIEFHEEVCRIADNAMLLNFVEQIHVWVRRTDYNPFTIPGRPAQGAAEHDRIIDALEAGDHALAESLTRQHMQTSHDLRLQLLKDAAN